MGLREAFSVGMPSFLNVFLCAAAELLLAVCVGLPAARRLLAPGPLAPALAPMIGWAVFNTLALPILTWAGFTRPTVALLFVAAVLGGVAASLHRRGGPSPERSGVRVSVSAYGAAALLAIEPALAVWPKFHDGGVVLSEAMFDHSKVAIIADILRLGLPPGNPFFAESGPRLVYYYLWHFSAAIPAALFGASGWEADTALTWFTAFASLALMMGLAVRFSGRSAAAWLVIVLSIAASLKPVLRLVLPADFLGRALASYPWPQSWIFQASWVPQHLASAGCVVLAVLTMAQLAVPRGWGLVPLLALFVAAAFESSAWVGGIVFAAAAVPIGIALLLTAENSRARLDFIIKAATAIVLVALVAFPFLRDDYAATAARHAGAPIALRPFAVLGPGVPAPIRSVLDLPAYWVILLVVQFPAICFAGAWAMARALSERGTPLAQRRFVIAFAVLAGASFVVPWLFASTIANNDLGWRGVLPGVLVLTIFAAAGLARWLTAARPLAVAAVALWALGLPGGLRVMTGNAVGLSTPSAPSLAASPALWAAVRRHTAADERIANNPLFLADSVRWPVNISWALFADRRSCYAGWNLARAFVPLPEADIDHIDALFNRVFAGAGSPGDVRDLAIRYDCRVIVVTPSDGAWLRDPFAGSRYFRLVDEQPKRWRIYRIVEGIRDRRQRPFSGAAATRAKVSPIRQAARTDPRTVPATLDLPPLRRR